MPPREPQLGRWGWVQLTLSSAWTSFEQCFQDSRDQNQIVPLTLSGHRGLSLFLPTGSCWLNSGLPALCGIHLSCCVEIWRNRRLEMRQP